MRPPNTTRLALRLCQQRLPAATPPALRPSLHKQLQCRAISTLPSEGRFNPRLSRFARYDEKTTEEIKDLKPRNPLNYVENERMRLRRNQYYRRRIYVCCVGIAVCVGIQLYIVFTFRDVEAQKKAEDNSNSHAHLKMGNSTQRLDAPPGSPANSSQPVQVLSTKPGDPSIKLDQFGHELVETGTSTIPHFPRTILVPSSSAQPSAQPISSVPGEVVEEGVEEYQLLGLGIRTVSFLGIQVYVLGMYIRTSDLDKLQSAFVRHQNPLGSSLIPSEKEDLRKDLMSAEKSLEIWDKVLKETRVRSAVRIVPTRGTDFAHLRDGWVRGITARTQEASRKGEGKTEFDEPGFGEGMGEFKKVLGGKGKAPKGSVLLLTRDERGVLEFFFASEKRESEAVVERRVEQAVGKLDDERISRQVWLGYLGGKNVSSEGARKSIVDGVLDLVERPVGTLGTQVV